MQTLIRIILMSSSLFMLTDARSQTNFFHPLAKKNQQTPGYSQFSQKIRQYRLLSLDETAMRAYLLAAPLEFNQARKTIALNIPLPDGSMETFGMVESPVLAPEIAARYPEIKTYSGFSLQRKQVSIRLTLTSDGFNALLLGEADQNMYIEKYNNETGVYALYDTRDAIQPPPELMAICNVTDREMINHSLKSRTPTTTANNSGATLRTFRFAIAATGEFTQAHTDVNTAYAVLVNYVNRLNAVTMRELCVKLMMVSDNKVVYPDPLTDPYDNTSNSTMLGQNQTNLDAIIGSANYDVGHVMGRSFGTGDGVAYIGVLCNSTYKGQGVTREGNATNVGQVFIDQTFFHEVGHQFGMTHSFNSVIPVCTTRKPETSVEPGSGATMMSYGFKCGGDDYIDISITHLQFGPLITYHTVNYEQADAVINAASCKTTLATGNHLPVITVPADMTIPKSTPFVLTGSATDADADALTYSWEGTNIGTMTPDATTILNTAQPPFFRSYGPVTTPVRTFPILSAILDGSNYAKGDKLPSVSVATVERFTVFDNHPGGGATVNASVTVIVDGNSGPFLVTNDLTGTVPGSSTQTVTWSVNNTNNPPVNAANVKISLSVDGGNSFPYVLAAGVPNNGTAGVKIPNITASQARVKVEAVGNIFFDISNTNFAITSVLPVELLAFDAQLQNKNEARLTWQTASEKNNAGFEVEMMDINGTQIFEKVGFMKGGGTTQALQSYNFNVYHLTPSTYYFRLKQIDQDSNFTYSTNQVLVVEGTGFIVNLFPNPVQSVLNMEFYLQKEGDVSLSLFNRLGQATLIVPARHFGSGRQSQLINTSGLASGVYYYRCETGADQLYGKIMVAQ